MAKGAKGIRDGGRCTTLRHELKHLKRPPDSFTDVTGLSFLIFECTLCGCQFGLTLDSKGEVDRGVIIPPERKGA